MNNTIKIILLTIAVGCLFQSVTAQPNQPLSGCQYILDDEACSQFLGKTKSEIELSIGKADKGRGDYYRFGFWLSYLEFKAENAYRVTEILFFGNAKDNNYKPFAAKPAKNLNWNAKKEEVIKKYGNPSSQQDLGDTVFLKYGKMDFQFRDNRLVNIRLNDVNGAELRQLANKQFDEQKVQNALSDCKFILDDNGCGKYFGKSAEEISDLFGKRLENNNYPDLGLFFYIWGDPENGVPMTVAEVTFYNTGKSVKQFYGQPGENLSWNATRDDLIKQYGKPTEETSWVESDNLPRSSLSFGPNVKLKIENNRLKEITIRSPKHNKDVEAYFRRLKEEQDRRDKEYSDYLAKQRELAKSGNATTGGSANRSNNAPAVVTAEVKAAYERMHNQVENLFDQANQKVEKFNKNQLIYESLGWRRRMQDEIDLLHIKAANLIRKFMTDYKGKLSKEMIDHLNEDLRKVTWQPNR